MLSRRRRLTAVVGAYRGYVAAVLVMFALLVGSQLVAAGPRPNPSTEPWPSFVMVYRETRHGPQGPVTQLFRVDYKNARDFSSTLLAHSSVPEAVGYTNTFRNNVSTTTDPRFGTRSETYGPDERTVPADWLVPASRPSITYRAGVQVTRLPAGLAVAREISSAGGRRVVLEITYREADGIPTLLVEQVEGTDVRRVEVLELSLQFK